MIRTAVVAAALVLAATQASAAEVRVSLAGKSADQISTELRLAARAVCAKESFSSPLFAGTYASCVRATFKSAQDKLTAA